MLCAITERLQSLTFLIILLFYCAPSLATGEMESSEASAPIFTAVSSKVIYPYSTYKISVFIEPNPASPQPVRVRASIISEKEEIPSEEIQVAPGASSVIAIQSGILKDKEYNLTVTVFDQREKKNESQAKLFASRKDKTILIQSDKPIYKPGETVKFRVVLLDRHLKPLVDDQVVDLLIQDGQRNLIKSFRDLNIHGGFYKNELELSSEPILGDWNLQVKLKPVKTQVEEEEDVEEIQQVMVAEAGSRSVASKRIIRPPYPRPPRPTRDDEDAMQKSLSFSVEQYVLPKYKVSIKPPSFITFKDYKFAVTVEAKYTYGKAVVGECTLTVKKAYFYSYNDEKEPIVTKTFPINGTQVVEVDIASLFSKKDENKYEQDVRFEAQVTEDVTGKMFLGTGSVRIYKNEYKMTQVKQIDRIKPGLPYSTTFKISTQDDTPIGDPLPNALHVKHGFSFDKKSGRFKTSIPPTGLVSMTFPTPTNELLHPTRIELKYKDLRTSFHMPSYYESSSGTYMQVKRVKREEETVVDELTDPTATVGSPMTININTTKPFQTLSYIIHGRQDVLAADTINLPQPVSDYNMEITCPDNADPEARLIVYTILESKEVLADSLKFQAKKLDPANFLNITLSEETREPGEIISLKLDTLQGSKVALRAVDQSVLLLKDDKDITQESLDEEVRNRESEAVWLNRNWGGTDAFKVFEEGGLVIITNAKINEREEVEVGHFGGNRLYSKQAVAMSAMADTVGMTQRDVRVRSNFPETWLWEEVTLNDSSSLDIKRIVPDTLTSWIITGYSLNSNAGVGVMKNSRKLTTFRPFFLTLNLPYSVVKEEVLLLQVLVHNYLPGGEPVSAEIELDNSEGKFSFADETIRNEPKQVKTISLSSNGISSVKFAIVPGQLGFISLKVKGFTATAGDAISQPLRVVPPGQKQQRTTAAILKPVNTAAPIEATLEAHFPEVRVDGADSLKLNLISDILGPTISNMDKLLQIPTGCGEQNLMSFVADIVILDYLDATHSLNTNVREKAIKFLEFGYQRQLTYRHYDGSFSAFGHHDTSGSTWLTAFAVRSFIQAKRYITIDDDVIKNALEFLSRHQTDAGGFYEVGRVFQTSLQGGSHSSGIALTAYTLLTFLEAKNNWDAPPETAGPPGEEVPVDRRKINSDITGKAVKFVTDWSVNKAPAELDDIYTLVITTYAAHMANHSSKDALFQKMVKAAKKNQGLVHWEVEKKNVSLNTTEGKIFLWEYAIQPVSVEMTSYALLTYILRGETPAAFPLVRWLLNQRNRHGGFLSTQDTVVGLMALAKYAELTQAVETNLKIDYNAGKGVKNVAINARNADVLQEYSLPQEARSVILHASGKGTVLAQLAWTYYVEDLVRTPSFSLQVNTTEKAPKELSLNICTHYLKAGNSNMAIVEVNLPSGYSFDPESLENLISVVNYKRHDVENQNTKLQVYLDSISSQDICIPLVANRVFTVGKQSPAYVSVYDYYDTTKTARAFFEAPKLSLCDICNETNECTANNCV